MKSLDANFCTKVFLKIIIQPFYIQTGEQNFRNHRNEGPNAFWAIFFYGCTFCKIYHGWKDENFYVCIITIFSLGLTKVMTKQYYWSYKGKH